MSSNVEYQRVNILSVSFVTVKAGVLFSGVWCKTQMYAIMLAQTDTAGFEFKPN